jgi:hypothetical protein
MCVAGLFVCNAESMMLAKLAWAM